MDLRTFRLWQSGQRLFDEKRNTTSLRTKDLDLVLMASVQTLPTLANKLTLRPLREVKSKTAS